MAFFPPEWTVIEDANREDGPAHAGAGAAFWSDKKLGGGASDLVVSSNQLAVTGTDAGALTADTHDDFLHAFKVATAGSGYIAWFWHLQDPESEEDWEGYWLLVQGGTWRINKRVDGTVTQIASESVGSVSDSDEIAIRHFEGLIEVYHKRGGVWGTEPVLTVTDTDLGAGPSYLNLDATDTRIDDILSGDPALPEPTEPVTLWVDADHPDASDDYNRSEVSEETPLASVQQACAIAYSTPDDAMDPFADEVVVKPAAAADPSNLNDPRMYQAIDHLHSRTSEYPAGLRFGDNSGRVPIVVRGVTVDGERPILAKINARRLKNWQFENFQIGYDVDSGLEAANLSSLQSCADLTFRDILWTGGAVQVDAWSGELLFEDCEVRAPLGPAETIHNGRGFGLSSEPGFTAPIEWGNATFRRCVFRLVRGDDGIQCGMTTDPTQGGLGAPGTVVEKGNLLVEDCVFWDVTEEGPGGDINFHCDSLQILGVPNTVIRRNVYFACSNALMASDFHNGRVVFENNLFVGGGGAVQIQGTDEIIIRHNSFFTVPGFSISDRTLIFFTRFQLPEPARLVIQNNILGGIYSEVVEGWSEDSVTEGNIAFAQAGEDPLGLGANLPALPELGTSDRMNDLPTESIVYGEVPPNYELANVPGPSFGIGAGVDLSESPDGPVETDRLGRAFSSPPDVGCHQSDLEVEVQPIPRAPYVLSRSPAPNSTTAPPNTNVQVVLYPVPGAEIDDSTVTTENAYLTDATGKVIPAVVSVSELDENGEQTITINPKYSEDALIEGTLYPLATYTARLTDGIGDTDGSALLPTSWSFRIAGPHGPAIRPAGTFRVAVLPGGLIGSL